RAPVVRVVLSPAGTALGCAQGLRRSGPRRRRPLDRPGAGRHPRSENDRLSTTPRDAGVGQMAPARAGMVAERRVVRRLVRRGLRSARIRSAALRAAATGGRGLILVYHRVTHATEPGEGIIPEGPAGGFRSGER